MQPEKIVYLKQRATDVAKYFGFDQLRNSDQNVFPDTKQSRSPLTEVDGKAWVTGLNPKSPRVLSITDPKRKEAEIKRLQKDLKYFEELLGEDLGPFSDYWLSFRIPMVDSTANQVKLNLDNPKDKLKLIVGKENRFYAPDYNSLEEEGYEGTNVYIHDPMADISRKQLFQETKDEVTSLIFSNRNNVDKLFYWAVALGKGATKNMSREDLYRLVTQHKENLKNLEEYQQLLDTLNKPAEELQLGYLVSEGLRRKRITKPLGGQYKLGDDSLGRSVPEVIETLRLAENNYLLDKLADLL